MNDPADRTTAIRATVVGLSHEAVSRLGGLIAGLDQLELILSLPEYPATAAGHAFGPFRLVARLGAGRFGVVALGEDPRLSRRVAIKVPQPTVLADPALRDRFLREARAAAALDHPGIVPVFETGEAGGLPYLAAGFVDGPTLAGWLVGRGGRVPPREAAGVVRAIAEAIHHAHERGVLHCDLKPGNVLMAAAESGPHPDPVVADFGLARLVGEDPTLTRTYGLLGTPLYMAPEQARGDRRGLTARTDTHALGAILYELLTGRAPFPGDSGEEVLRRVETDQPPCPGAVNPAVPRDLRAVCLRCLQKDPRDRYPSTGELAADLDRFLAGQPVTTRHVGPVTRAARWARRNPLAVAAAVAFGGLLAGLGVVQAGRWADGVRHDANLKAEAAERAKAEGRAAAAEFFTGIDRVRRRRDDLETDWPTKNLADLRRLATSPVAGGNLTVLRTEAANALGGFDLGTPQVVGEGFRAYNPVFSPDGKLLALGEWKADVRGTCRVKVFDVATREEARELTYGSDWDWDLRAAGWLNMDGCRAIAWSPDGRWLVVGTRSGRLVRWDLTEPAPQPAAWRHSPPGPNPANEHPRTLAFTPSGRVLVSLGHNQVAGWNAAKGWAEVFRRDGGGDRLPRPARLGDPLYAAAAAGGFRVIEKAPWVRTAALPPANAAGPRGEWFVGEWPTGGQLHLFRGERPVEPSGAFCMPGEDRAEDAGFHDILVHPRGHLIATAAEHARHLKVWSVVGGELAARTLDGGSLRVAIDPAGDRLAVVTDAGTLVYDLRGRGVCEAVGVGPVPLADADLTADGRAGAAISAGQSRDPSTHVATWGADGPRGGADEPGPGADNNRLVAVDPAGGWVCYAAGDGCMVRTLPLGKPGLAFPERGLRDLRADPAGRLWSTGKTGLRRWDLRDRPLAGPALQPAVTIRRAAGPMCDCLAPGTEDVWVGRDDGAVCRHPAAGGDPDCMVPAFDVGVAGIARSADGSRVIAGSVGGGVKVIDAGTGRVEVDLPDAHRDAVRAVAFLPNGWFATGSRDRTVKLWDAAGRPVLTLPQTRPVRRLFGSADGTTLTVLAEGERGLRRWRLDLLKAGLADLGIDPGLP